MRRTVESLYADALALRGLIDERVGVAIWEKGRNPPACILRLALCRVYLVTSCARI